MQNEFDDDELLHILDDPLFWDPPRLLDAKEIESIFEEVAAEDRRAGALCDALLTGPSQTWMERFSAIPEARTPGVVRVLLRRTPALFERRPADALQATAVAVAISESLEPIDRWPDYVHMVRGQALREHARVLSLFGRSDEALPLVDVAERTFAQIVATDFDLALLAHVKAIVLGNLDRAEEALEPVREAAGMFLELKEHSWYLSACLTEALLVARIKGTLDAATFAQTDPGGDEPRVNLERLRRRHDISQCNLGYLAF